METIQEVLKRIVKQEIVIYENGQQTPVTNVVIFENGQIVEVATADAPQKG